MAGPFAPDLRQCARASMNPISSPCHIPHFPTGVKSGFRQMTKSVTPFCAPAAIFRTHSSVSASDVWGSVLLDVSKSIFSCVLIFVDNTSISSLRGHEMPRATHVHGLLQQGKARGVVSRFRLSCRCRLSQPAFRIGQIIYLQTRSEGA
jgi:hypothetical protein